MIARSTVPHGRLIVTVNDGSAEFERHLIQARATEGRACRGRTTDARDREEPERPSPDDLGGMA